MANDFDVTIDVSATLALASMLEAAGTTAPVRAAAVVTHYGAALHSAVTSRAPGTNYPATIRVEHVARGAFVGVGVGTDRPDGFRREMGFHGLDRKGRRYSDAGNAHFEPGFNSVAPAFTAAMVSLTVLR